MEITNKHNLPEAFVNAVMIGTYAPKPNRTSVTKLIDPPLITLLLRKHWAELKEDAIDRIWAIMGGAWHAILEKHAPQFTFAELKLITQEQGIDVVGIADLMTPKEELIEDYKTTSVWGVVLGDKKQIERQLNLLAAIFRRHGWPVSALRGNYLLKDWQARRAHEDDYPSHPIHIIKVPVWPAGLAEEYLVQRVSEYLEQEAIFNAEGVRDFMECDSESKWEKPMTWAVKVKGVKKAKRVLDSQADAATWMADKDLKGSFIEERPGECTRCLNYCPVRSVCPFSKRGAK